MTDQRKSQPEQPRYEPEIIPPGETHDPMGTRVFIDHNTSERVFVGRVGPGGLLLMSLVIAAAVAVVLVLILGAFLIWIPVVGILIAAGLVMGVLRPLFARQ